MDSRKLTPAVVLLFAAVISSGARISAAAEAPTPAQALSLTPIQTLVDFATPSKEDAAQCTIRPEKENNVTSWVVRNRQGEMLRRFADTNGDNIVDQWCYFSGGLEVYRDIDSNFNGKADEYRWFNTGGTRWGLDKDENGRIDSWKVISPYEVAEQVLFALKTRDATRFQLLLLTPDELGSLGFGKTRAESVAETIKAAPAALSKILAEQKIVTPQSRYVDFGSARPAMIPIGTGGSTKDVIICDNATALVQSDDKHEQIFLGTLISVGDTWKLIEVPAVGSENQRQDGGFLIASNSSSAGSSNGENAPNEEMQKLMAELERLDKSNDQSAATMELRVNALQKLAGLSPERDRDQWYRQLIDVLSVAIQSGAFPQGVERLEQLQKTLTDAKADDDLIGHAAFQRTWAQYAVSQKDPAVDAAKLQEIQAKWLTDLQAFIGQYPKSADTAEALYQLGTYQEFIGKSEEAAKLYQQLVTNFPKANPAEKASGALNRLGSLGKPVALRGTDVQGNAVDIAQYRGKVVLIHYWGTMGDRWQNDLVVLKDFYAKKGGRDFDIIGVCLDDNAAAAKQYLAQNKIPWKQICEPGGLDGKSANQMGVITLPLMILVDQKGNVANQNMHEPELDAELTKLTKPAEGTANALRSPPTSR